MLAAATAKFARVWLAGEDLAATVLTSPATLSAFATSTDHRFAALGSRDAQFGVGAPGDLSLALYRVGRRSVTVDRLPGTRPVPGLLNEFLMENAATKNHIE